MNKTQIQTTIAPALAFLAGMLAGKGVFGWDETTWLAVLSGAVGLGATIWGAVVTTRKALVVEAVKAEPATMVTAVANLPQVTMVELDSTVQGTGAIEASTPNNVYVK